MKQDLFLEVWLFYSETHLWSGVHSQGSCRALRQQSKKKIKSIFYPFPYSIYFSSHRVQEGYLSLAAVGGSNNLEIEELSS